MRWFSIFLIFLNHIWLDFKFRSNSRWPSCMLGGCREHVYPLFWGSTPSGHLPVFSRKILSCTLCTPSSNLNLNAFSSKIIQYMATYRDNSSSPGFDHPNMSPTYEKWSGGIACLSFGSHFTKNRHLATIKKKNHIFVSKNNKTIV